MSQVAFIARTRQAVCGATKQERCVPWVLAADTNKAVNRDYKNTIYDLQTKIQNPLGGIIYHGNYKR